MHIYDARELDQDSLGGFDAITSLGGSAHFCSPEDHRARRQEHVYRRIFEQLASTPPIGGRPYLQPMVFGQNRIPADQVNIAFTSGVSANKICFERELLDHYRLVFEKSGDSSPLPAGS